MTPNLKTITQLSRIGNPKRDATRSDLKEGVNASRSNEKDNK